MVCLPPALIMARISFSSQRAGFLVASASDKMSGLSDILSDAADIHRRTVYSSTSQSSAICREVIVWPLMKKTTVRLLDGRSGNRGGGS